MGDMQNTSVEFDEMNAAWLSFKVTKYICFFFAAYLSLNTIMNMISKSRKEKYVMTPLSLIAGICFWITAFQM